MTPRRITVEPPELATQNLFYKKDSYSRTTVTWQKLEDLGPDQLRALLADKREKKRLSQARWRAKR